MLSADGSFILAAVYQIGTGARESASHSLSGRLSPVVDMESL